MHNTEHGVVNFFTVSFAVLILLVCVQLIAHHSIHHRRGYVQTLIYIITIDDQ